MKLGLFATFANPFTTGETVRRTGEESEARGIDSIWLGEHVVFFRDYESKYPYAADGKIPASSGTGLVEPFTTMGLLAGRTETVRLGTGICLLPQRNPLYTAKEVSSLDYLSGGRIDFGVGVGWCEEEFDACGVDWPRRGARTDEYIDMIKKLWTEDETSFDGEFWQLPASEMFPKPAADPHPPIIIGGESDAAMRRVARVGDGWLGFNHTPDTASESIERLTKILEDNDRSIDDIEVTVCPYFQPVDASMMDAYAKAGVDQVIVLNFAMSPDDVASSLDDIAPMLDAAHSA